MSFSLMPHIARFLIEPYDPCMSDVHKPLQVVLTNRIAVATDNACVDVTGWLLAFHSLLRNTRSSLLCRGH